MTRTLQEAKEEDCESSKGNMVMEKSVQDLGKETMRKDTERGKEQIICWHWAVKGWIKL